MSTPQPLAHLGVILSSGNRFLEPFFRAHAPAQLGIHVTRMRMASGRRRSIEEKAADAVAAASLLADAGVDVIDLQGTGIVMEAGPEGEAQLIGAITEATGIPAYTASQALMEALGALAVKRVVVITPFDTAANAKERAYMEAAGVTVAAEFGLGHANGSQTGAIPPETWIEAATENDRADADGFVLSGSNTTMVEAIARIEDATGKPAVTSIQAALWAGTRRLTAKLGDVPVDPALGRLGQVALTSQGRNGR